MRIKIKLLGEPTRTIDVENENVAFARRLILEELSEWDGCVREILKIPEAEHEEVKVR